MGEIRNAHKTLVRKRQVKRSRMRPRVSDMEVEKQEVKCELNSRARDRVQRWVIVKTVGPC